MTVAKVELPLPSTAPGFFHVTLDSSGLCKDVPMDQLYSFRLDAHDLLTENVGARAQVAPVRNAIRCCEPLTALFYCIFFLHPAFGQCFMSLQMIGRIPQLAQPIAESEGVPKNELIITSLENLGQPLLTNAALTIRMHALSLPLLRRAMRSLRCSRRRDGHRDAWSRCMLCHCQSTLLSLSRCMLDHCRRSAVAMHSLRCSLRRDACSVAAVAPQ